MGRPFVTPTISRAPSPAADRAPRPCGPRAGRVSGAKADPLRPSFPAPPQEIGQWCRHACRTPTPPVRGPIGPSCLVSRSWCWPATSEDEEHGLFGTSAHDAAGHLALSISAAGFAICALRVATGSARFNGPDEPSIRVRRGPRGASCGFPISRGHTPMTSTRPSSPAKSQTFRVYNLAPCAWAVAAMSRSMTRRLGCLPASTTAAARRP